MDQIETTELVCAWCYSPKVAPIAGMQGRIGDILGVFICFECGGPNELIEKDRNLLLRKPPKPVENNKKLFTIVCAYCGEPGTLVIDGMDARAWLDDQFRRGKSGPAMSVGVMHTDRHYHHLRPDQWQDAIDQVGRWSDDRTN